MNYNDLRFTGLAAATAAVSTAVGGGREKIEPFRKSSAYLAIISTLPMAFAISRLTDLSIILWVTDDFGGGDFPKKAFLMDYLRWKNEKPMLSEAMILLNFFLMMTKYDMIVGLLQRALHVCQKKKRFHTRHLFDVLDCAGVLGIMLARDEYKLASDTTVEACEVIDGMRWNYRATKQVLACENEAFNLRRLYIWLMGLNMVMLVCPIIRHLQWERAEKQKAMQKSA